MNYFKLKASTDAPVYHLSEFEDITKNMFPFERLEGHALKRYAICPFCMNPIEIKGLWVGVLSAKHALRDVSYIEKWNQEAFENCPYATEEEKKLKQLNGDKETKKHLDTTNIDDTVLRTIISNEEKEIAIKLTTHPIGTLRNELSKRKHHPELARRGWAKYCHTKTIEYTIKHYDVLRNVLFEDYMNMSPWYKRWDEILAKLPAEDISYLPNSPEDDCESKY